MSAGPAFRAALAGMLSMAVAMGIGRFVYTPLLPVMIGADAFDAADAGYVAGANYLGYLVGALMASRQVFLPQRRLWTFAGLGFSILTNLAMALQPGVAEMASIRFLSGFASAFAMIFSTIIVMRRLAAERRPGLVAFHFAGVGLGITLSALLVSVMTRFGANWPSMWLGSGVLGAVLLAGAWLALPPRIGGTVAEPDEGDTDPPFPRRLRIYIVGYGFFGFGYVISATFINAMARAEPSLQALEPWVWTIVGLSILPSVWFWNRFAVIHGIGAAYAIACFVEAVGVGLPVLFVHPLVLAISAVLLGGTFVAVTALGLSEARAMAPFNTARAIALMTAAFGIGQMIGPVVAGLLFQRFENLAAASLLAAAALLLAAGIAIYVALPSFRSGSVAT